MNIKILCQNIENNPNEFNSDRLESLFTEFAEEYHKEQLNITSVSKCYTEKDMDNAYDKGFNDGNQRDLTGSLIESL